MTTPFLLPQDQAAFILNLFGKLFSAGSGFGEEIEEQRMRFSPTELDFLVSRGLAYSRPEIDPENELFYAPGATLRALAENMQLSAQRILVSVRGEEEVPWYNQASPGATLPPLTAFPYILPHKNVEVNALFKGRPLTVYDVLMAMRALNVDRYRDVATSATIFSRGAQATTWDVEITVDIDD